MRRRLRVNIYFKTKLGNFETKVKDELADIVKRANKKEEDSHESN